MIIHASHKNNVRIFCNAVGFLAISILAASIIQGYHSGFVAVSPFFFSSFGCLLSVALIKTFCLEKKEIETKKVKKKWPELGLTFANPKEGPETEDIQLQITSDGAESYHGWLFKHKKAMFSQQIDILEATYRKPTPGPLPLVRMIRPQNHPSAHLDLIPGKVAVRLDQKWAEFNQAGEYYVNFTNAYDFLGGFRYIGCVQEERLGWAFSAFGHIAYAAEKAGRPIHIWKRENGLAPSHSFLIFDVRKEFDISAAPYGTELFRTPAAQWKDKIKPIEDSPPIHILSIAAIDWQDIVKKRLERRPYRKQELIYHYESAFFAFREAAKAPELKGKRAVIHTGAWGAGAFKNSEKTMIFLQLLAARAANVDLVLHGVDTDKLQPHFTTKFVNECQKFIDDNPRTSVIGFIDQILQWQKQDPSWRIKPKD